MDGPLASLIIQDWDWHCQTVDHELLILLQYKKKVEELERKIAGLQIHSNDLKSPEDIFRDDLEALQLERLENRH